MKRLLFFVAAVVAALASAGPVSAVIVHHCDYTPQSEEPAIHAYHSGMNGCTNFDASEVGTEGTCDYSSGFYHTALQCSEFGCNVYGEINCGGTKHQYDLNCFGNNAQGFGTRTSAGCIADNPGGGGGDPQNAQVCTCDDFSGCLSGT